MLTVQSIQVEQRGGEHHDTQLPPEVQQVADRYVNAILRARGYENFRGDVLVTHFFDDTGQLVDIDVDLRPSPEAV